MGVVVVTGGGRGIGAATALACASTGFDVCIGYRASAATASDVAAACAGAGVRAVAVQADVAVEAEVAALFAAADELGPLTALVNNAGVTASAGRVDSFSAGRVEELFRVNVVSAFLCSAQAVRRMSTRYGGSGGSIVNVSSRAAVLGGSSEYVDYAATKGAIDTLTVGLAREVAGEGIRVNAVRPGLIETQIHATTGDPDRVRRLSGTVPMGRGGQPEEVAAAIVWLLSPAASYVTGTFVDVGGGR